MTKSMFRIGWAVLGLGLPATAGPEPASPPNVVVVLADDLGIECLTTYGGKSHKTPNLDKLVAQGMRFTHCFSHPYCSPSRASLLTGQYPFRNGIREVIYDLKRHSDLYLRTDQTSFPRQLKQAGYTTAIAGKWQLSFLHQRNTITDFGFDQYQCWQIFRPDGSKTRRFLQPHFIRNGEIIADDIADQYGPDVNVEFLIDFIRGSTEKKQPFLAYYTSLLPHFPWVPTPDSGDQKDPLTRATDIGDPKFFPDMVTYLDKNVGRLMQTLDDLGIADDTVLIFVADNGTDQRLTNHWGEGKSILGGKGSMTDRGTRVPLIVRWPGHIKAGSTCDDLIDLSDFLPTLCELAAAPLPEKDIHGRSFAPQLLGKASNPRQWVHVQDKTSRHLRNRDFILTDSNQLRPVVEIWEKPAMAIPPKLNRKEQTAQKSLKAAFDQLGD